MATELETYLQEIGLVAAMLLPNSSSVRGSNKTVSSLNEESEREFEGDDVQPRTSTNIESESASTFKIGWSRLQTTATTIPESVSVPTTHEMAMDSSGVEVRPGQMECDHVTQSAVSTVRSSYVRPVASESSTTPIHHFFEPSTAPALIKQSAEEMNKREVLSQPLTTSSPAAAAAAITELYHPSSFTIHEEVTSTSTQVTMESHRTIGTNAQKVGVLSFSSQPLLRRPSMPLGCILPNCSSASCTHDSQRDVQPGADAYRVIHFPDSHFPAVHTDRELNRNQLLWSSSSSSSGGTVQADSAAAERPPERGLHSSTTYPYNERPDFDEKTSLADKSISRNANAVTTVVVSNRSHDDDTFLPTDSIGRNRNLSSQISSLASRSIHDNSPGHTLVHCRGGDHQTSFRYSVMTNGSICGSLPSADDRAADVTLETSRLRTENVNSVLTSDLSHRMNRNFDANDSIDAHRGIFPTDSTAIDQRIAAFIDPIVTRLPRFVFTDRAVKNLNSPSINSVLVEHECTPTGSLSASNSLPDTENDRYNPTCAAKRDISAHAPLQQMEQRVHDLSDPVDHVLITEDPDGSSINVNDSRQTPTDAAVKMGSLQECPDFDFISGQDITDSTAPFDRLEAKPIKSSIKKSPPDGVGAPRKCVTFSGSDLAHIEEYTVSPETPTSNIFPPTFPSRLDDIYGLNESIFGDSGLDRQDRTKDPGHSGRWFDSFAADPEQCLTDIYSPEEGKSVGIGGSCSSLPLAHDLFGRTIIFVSSGTFRPAESGKLNGKSVGDLNDLPKNCRKLSTGTLSGIKSYRTLVKVDFAQGLLDINHNPGHTTEVDSKATQEVPGSTQSANKYEGSSKSSGDGKPPCRNTIPEFPREQFSVMMADLKKTLIGHKLARYKMEMIVAIFVVFVVVSMAIGLGVGLTQMT